MITLGLHRCGRILDSCATAPRTVRELVEAVFTRNLDGVMVMALAEVLAQGGVETVAAGPRSTR